MSETVSGFLGVRVLPLKTSNFRGGGEGYGEGGRAVVVLCDQNFPAVLPSAGGKCVAIMRVEHGTLKDLVELIEKVAPPPDPGWNDFPAWFADPPAEGGTAELLCIWGKIWPQTGKLLPRN
jgi:hypothetical protein